MPRLGALTTVYVNNKTQHSTHLKKKTHTNTQKNLAPPQAEDSEGGSMWEEREIGENLRYPQKIKSEVKKVIHSLFLNSRNLKITEAAAHTDLKSMKCFAARGFRAEVGLRWRQISPRYLQKAFQSGRTGSWTNTLLNEITTQAGGRKHPRSPHLHAASTPTENPAHDCIHESHWEVFFSLKSNFELKIAFSFKSIKTSLKKTEAFVSNVLCLKKNIQYIN